MNSITRLILHRVAAGHVPLTPQVIEVLKEVSEDHAADPVSAPYESIASASETGPATPSPESRCGFLSPTGPLGLRMN